MDKPTNSNPADEEVKQEAAAATQEQAADKNSDIKRADGEETKEGEGEEAEERFETNWEMEVDKFDDMGLKEEVLRGIYAFGFKEPSPIQQKAILPII